MSLRLAIALFLYMVVGVFSLWLGFSIARDRRRFISRSRRTRGIVKYVHHASSRAVNADFARIAFQLSDGNNATTRIGWGRLMPKFFVGQRVNLLVDETGERPIAIADYRREHWGSSIVLLLLGFAMLCISAFVWLRA